MELVVDGAILVVDFFDGTLVLGLFGEEGLHALVCGGRGFFGGWRRAAGEVTVGSADVAVVAGPKFISISAICDWAMASEAASRRGSRVAGSASGVVASARRLRASAARLRLSMKVLVIATGR